LEAIRKLFLGPRTDSASKPPKIAPKTDIGEITVFRLLFEDFNALASCCTVMAKETGLSVLSRPTWLREID
jgi:hypothetical protein